MRTTIGLAAGLAAGLASALALAAGAAHAEQWDMPMAYAASNYHTETGEAFAQCVGTATGGDITITVHASGSLFGGAEIKRAVQTGQAPIGERLLSAHQNENILFGIDSVPFLATTFEESDKLWQAAEPTIEEILAEQNLELIYTTPWPPQGLYTNKPIESVEDLEGIKFRAYNNATARFAELTGMQPVQIEAAELSQAFATGVAESMISSGATGYDRKVWEHLTHFYEINAWMPRNAVFVNSDTWEALSEANRNAVQGCADLAAYAGHARAVQYTDFTVNALAENGMTVAPPGDELAGQLAEIGETMAAEWLEEAGEAGQEIVDRYREMQ